MPYAEEKNIHFLGEVQGVHLEVEGQTVLYVSPEGKRGIITDIIFLVTEISDLLAPANIKVGVDQNSKEVFGTTSTQIPNLPALNTVSRLSISNGLHCSFGSGEEVKLNVIIPAKAKSLIVTVFVYGFNI